MIPGARIDGRGREVIDVRKAGVGDIVIPTRELSKWRGKGFVPLSEWTDDMNANAEAAPAPEVIETEEG